MNKATSQHNGLRKWGKVVKNFMDSERPVVKITDPIDARSSSACLYQYLKNRDYPVRYFRSQNDIYLFRSDVLSLSLNEAIDNQYPEGAK